MIYHFCILNFMIQLINLIEASVIVLPLHQEERYLNQVKTVVNASIGGNFDDGYYVLVNIGSPPQKLALLIDTGSSNLAVAASSALPVKRYFHMNESESFHLTGKSVKIKYVQGQWSGTLGSDLISIPNSPSITTRCNVACILSSEDVFSNVSNWQGLLGLAYSAVAKPDSSVTPYFDALVADGKVENIFSIALCDKPQIQNVKQSQGKLVLGGIENSLYTGDILYTRIHKEWFYEVILTNITVGSKKWEGHCSELNNDKTIIDTGTSALYLPEKVFTWVKQSLHKTDELKNQLNERFWKGQEDVCIQKGRSVSEYFHQIEMVFGETFNSSVSLVIPPELFLWKTPQIVPDNDCYKLGIASSKVGTIIGAVILEGFYVIYDRENKRIGFANSTCTHTTAAVIRTMNMPKDPKDCAHSYEEESGSSLLVIAYILSTLCILCAIPLLVMLTQWIWHHLIKKRGDTSEASSLIDD
ncbi:beta-secretase 1-like [Limulus polyphemus]|uniref:Beta-secretase 1-like n=1 Tax=Limulus polyphemus TaxID=6850 RepID=A0ABM1B761_LIMPO|nr:beta-secretase 1-like [Limulus polyphemus]